jgi:hypothetical protein
MYDATGNRTTVTTGAGTVNYTTASDNRLSSDGTWNYTYFTNGNLQKKVRISDGLTWSYVYDHWNRLIGFQRRTTDGGTLELDGGYAYDALGNRVEKLVDSDGAGPGSMVVSKYAYDAWNPAKGAQVGTENADVWGDFTSGGALTTRYLRGDKIDELIARIDGSTPYWYLTDHQGSTRKIVDGAGAVRDTIVYDAYGNENGPRPLFHLPWRVGRCEQQFHPQGE